MVKTSSGLVVHGPVVNVIHFIGVEMLQIRTLRWRLSCVEVCPSDFPDLLSGVMILVDLCKKHQKTCMPDGRHSDYFLRIAEVMVLLQKNHGNTVLNF